MSASPSPFLWLALLLLVLLPLLSLATVLLERSGPIRLRHWVEETGGRLRRLWEDPARFGLYRTLLNLTAKLVPLALFLALGTAVDRIGLRHPFVYAVAVVALAVAGSEIAGRRLLRRGPERALAGLTWIYRSMFYAYWPLIALLGPFLASPDDLFGDGSESDEASEEEVEAFIEVGTQEGILEPEDRDLVWGVVDFGDTLARSVMTPRVDMVCGRMSDSLDRLAEIFNESEYSRLPLYRESVDQIVAVLHLRDLFRALRTQPRPALEAIVQTPLFIPGTKHLGELLKEFQARRQQMAIVLNEFGGTEGVVTIEDLVEEIVGEIADEHDDESPENRLLEDGSLLLDGRAALETLNEFFGVTPVEEEYETVGGLLSGISGQVPTTGTTLEHAGLLFDVEKADDRRVLSVRVRRAAAMPDSTQEER
ncbi:MAG: hemolysin family protein [Thermoanaerobaculia bacterium]